MLGNDFSALIKVDNGFKTLPFTVLSLCLSASSSLLEVQRAPLADQYWLKNRCNAFE